MSKKLPNSRPNHAAEAISAGSSRRRFLGQLAQAGLAIGSTGVLADNTKPHLAPILTRRVPSSGEALPVLGLGTARTFNVDTADSALVTELRQVLQRFFELGGRVVDSSPMYGDSEALTGMMGHQLGITDQLFFATKVWAEGETEGERQMNTSAKHFQTDVVDLMQVHNLLDLDTQLASIRKRREQGRVRYVGITHYRDDMHDKITDVLLREPLDFVQINYSIVSRAIERRLLDVAADRGVAVIINQAFERGRLFRLLGDAALPDWVEPFGISSWAQYMLKFVLSHPAVSMVIPAAEKIEYIDDNMQAARGLMPDQTMRERMAQHFETLI